MLLNLVIYFDREGIDIDENATGGKFVELNFLSGVYVDITNVSIFCTSKVKNLRQEVGPRKFLSFMWHFMLHK